MTYGQIRSFERSMLKTVDHRLAFEIAPLGHALLDRLDLLLVDEHLEVAGIGEIDLGGEHRRRDDAPVVAHGHERQRHRQHGAADAIADGVDLVLAGRLFDCVERGERALAHIVFERLAWRAARPD